MQEWFSPVLTHPGISLRHAYSAFDEKCSRGHPLTDVKSKRTFWHDREKSVNPSADYRFPFEGFRQAIRLFVLSMTGSVSQIVLLPVFCFWRIHAMFIRYYVTLDGTSLASVINVFSGAGYIKAAG